MRAPANRQFASLTDGRHYTYGDIDAVSARFANVLTELGVRPDDRVAVQVPKSIEALMLYLATLRVGAIFLPLNTGYTPAEVETFLVDAAPRLFVCDPDAEAELRPVAGRAGPGSRPWASGAPRCPRPARWPTRLLAASASYHRPRNADLAALLYTSGTTGRSKGAMLTHENLQVQCRGPDGDLAFRRRRRVAPCPADLPHPWALRRHQHHAALPAAMLFLPRFEVDEVLDLLPEASVMGVPTFYTRLLLRRELPAALTARMRLFISGSAPLAPRTMRNGAPTPVTPFSNATA